LIRFFCHPARYFCERRLGFFLRDDSDPFENKEPFDLTGLERYHLENEELEARRRDKETSFLFERARAEGILPHGPGGEQVYRELEGKVDRFVRSIAHYQDNPLEPISLQLKINGFTIQAHFANLYETGLLHCRYATVKAKDLLRAWLSHLFINSEKNVFSQGGCLTRLVGTDQVIIWRPFSDSHAILADLLDLYWQGMSAPLPFFPGASLAFAELMLDERQEKALAAAYKAWNGGYQRIGEGDDVYYQLFFKDQNSLDEHFAGLALRIFSPLLEHEE
jgi:exodeoxyribonuclease V gamma subunit